MRVRLWAALAAVLALSAPLQARAQDARSQGESRAAFAVFRDVCIAGNGDADYAIGKLRAQGWVAIPDELGASMKQELGPDAVVLLNFDVDTLTVKTPNGMGLALAVVGVAPPEAFGVDMSGPFCGISPMEGDAEAIRASFEAYYPFPPLDASEGAVWIFTQENGTVVPADVSAELTDEEGMALIRQRPHFMAAVIQEEATAILLFMRLAPED